MQNIGMGTKKILGELSPPPPTDHGPACQFSSLNKNGKEVIPFLMLPLLHLPNGSKEKNSVKFFSIDLFFYKMMSVLPEDRSLGKVNR